MAVNIGPRAVHVVIDTAGFIERADLSTFGVVFHTSSSVISEIRDKKTRDYIATLPFEILVDNPSAESIKFATTLSAKTGDLFALSKTDLEVIALSYELYKRETEDEPDIKVESKRNHCPSSSSTCDTEHSPTLSSTPQEDASDVDESEWISAENFSSKLTEGGLGLGTLHIDSDGDDDAEAAEQNELAPVACLTKDFAIQNVLMHANIRILGLNGKIIKSARTNVLWCGTCHVHTTKPKTYFCPSCGYANLRRIPVTLHENGQLEFHFARHFKKNLRGTKRSIRRPKGGKYADEPIYKAHQRIPDRRPPKPKNPLVAPMAATNGLLDTGDDLLLNPEELIYAFPGGEGDLLSHMFPTHDVTSKAACHGLRSDGQIPPQHWQRIDSIDPLKPTRFRATLPGRRRTGNKRKKLTK